MELDKFTDESWLHHRLSKITSGPFFHLSEHNEDSNSYFTRLKTMTHFKTQNRDFSVGPVVKRLHIPMQGIPGQGARIPHALWPKKQKNPENPKHETQAITNSTKTLKMVHIKKS